MERHHAGSVSLAIALLLHNSPSGSTTAQPSPQRPQQQPASTPPTATATSAATFDHSAFDSLLQKHVKRDRVDYAALKGERATLDGYVDRLAKLPQADLEKLPRAEQMAFWIDAYNAITLKTVIDAYPIEGSGLSGLRYPKNSIRQLGDQWTRKHTIANQQLSLDDVENKILRPTFKDPRVHAAINCASKGCPPLRSEAFVGARLDAQLADQMKRFVTDGVRNQIDVKAKKVLLSSIFDWFGEDFGTKQDQRAILSFLAKNGPADWKPFLDGFDPGDVDFLDYDWALNDVDR